MAQYVYTMRRVGKVVPPKRVILKDISLIFFPGAKIGVLGLNGAGKSSLLRIMAGEDKNFEGEAIPMPNMRIGFLPQEPHLDPEKDVRGNVEEGVGDTLALIHAFNAISDQFAEPLEDDEMNRLLEEQGELQAKIDAAQGWEVERRAGDRRRRAAAAAVGRRGDEALRRRAAGASRSVACSSPSRTCCSSTSRPTISTRFRCSGSSSTSSAIPAR